MTRATVVVFAALAAGACGGSQKSVMSAPAGEPSVQAAPTPSVSEEPGEADVARLADQSPSPQSLTFPDEEFRKIPPAASALKAFDAPDIQRFRLKNGLAVYLVESHLLPTVAMTLVFDGGELLDPKGKDGMVAQCMALVDDGTTKLDKLEYEAALADLASSVSAGASEDQHHVSMRTLSRNLDETLDLWVGVVREPGLREADLERNKQRTRAALEQQKGSPAALAGRVEGPVMWGQGHPRGGVPTEKSVMAVTAQDCESFVSRALRPGGAKLFVAGDVTREKLTSLLESRLASWKGRGPRLAAGGRGRPMQGKIFFVDVPGAEQSVVKLMHFGPPRSSRDYVATHLMNTVLGGDFTSRINMNIREEHGYSYGARSGFDYDKKGSVFTASSSVRGDVTVESIQEIVMELERMRTEPATADELERAQLGEVLALPARWSTSASVLGTYAGLVYFGLPLNYYVGYVDSVKDTKQADVARAARKYLRPDDVTLLVVGDGESVLPRLKEYARDRGLSEKDLVQLDPDGKPAGRPD